MNLSPHSMTASEYVSANVCVAYAPSRLREQAQERAGSGTRVAVGHAIRAARQGKTASLTSTICVFSISKSCHYRHGASARQSRR